MYITDATNNVRELYENIEELTDIDKMKFVLYIFDLLNNNQINNKNIVNPHLNQDNDDLVIFNFSTIGFPANFITYFLQFNIMIYNKLDKDIQLYEDAGSVKGLILKDKVLEIVQKFEKLSYNEKLDTFAEFIIRYDNDSFFNELESFLDFSSQRNGYEIARDIEKSKI